jgi:hypothetical protein
MKMSPNPCKNFKKYKAERQPRGKCCFSCWMLWHQVEGDRLYKKFLDARIKYLEKSQNFSKNNVSRDSIKYKSDKD